MTASHNPGGPEGDFGIKYNVSNGGPAPVAFTDRIYKMTKMIKDYKICPDLDVDISKVGETKFFIANGVDFVVDVVDPVKDYSAMMKTIFDFKVSFMYIRCIR